jgi:hypothetical protein
MKADQSSPDPERTPIRIESTDASSNYVGIQIAVTSQPYNVLKAFGVPSIRL